jgi:hypothetical protein
MPIVLCLHVPLSLVLRSDRDVTISTYQLSTVAMLNL